MTNAPAAIESYHWVGESFMIELSYTQC